MEALAGRGVVGNPIGEQLEGDEAMEPTVFSLVHDAHATTAEDIEKPIVRDCALWHGRQGL